MEFEPLALQELFCPHQRHQVITSGGGDARDEGIKTRAEDEEVRPWIWPDSTEASLQRGSAICRAHPLPLAASSGKAKRQRWVPASPAGISVRWVGATQEKWKKEEMREAARTRFSLGQGAKATGAGE